MREGRKRTDVPKDVFWLILLSSFSTIGFGYLTTATTAYLPEQGVSSGDVGLIVGITGLAMIVSAIPFGILSDRIGRKRILAFGLFGVPPAMLLCAFGPRVDMFLLAGIIGGISEGAFLSTWNAMIADLTVVENRNRSFAYSFIIGGIFMSLGLALPFLFPWMQDLSGSGSVAVHSYAFIIIGLLSLISPLAILRMFRDYHEKGLDAKIRRGHFLKGRSKQTLVRFSVNNTLIGLGAGLIIPLIPTWFYLVYDIPDSISGPLLAVSGLSIAMAAIFSTRLSERLGQVKAITVTQLSSTIFMLAIPFMPGALIAGVMYLVRSALMNMAGPILDSYLMGIVDKEDRGLASAINSIVWRIPNSVTTMIGGAMLAAGSYVLPFVLASGIYALAVTAFFINFRNVKPSDA